LRVSTDAAACKGIRADVAGTGEVCLDPGDPARRDFRDCDNEFCGPDVPCEKAPDAVRGLVVETRDAQ
jgi:hypothetical protein